MYLLLCWLLLLYWLSMVMLWWWLSLSLLDNIVVVVVVVLVVFVVETMIAHLDVVHGPLYCDYDYYSDWNCCKMMMMKYEMMGAVRVVVVNTKIGCDDLGRQSASDSMVHEKNDDMGTVVVVVVAVDVVRVEVTHDSCKNIVVAVVAVVVVVDSVCIVIR